MSGFLRIYTQNLIFFDYLWYDSSMQNNLPESHISNEATLKGEARDATRANLIASDAPNVFGRLQGNWAFMNERKVGWRDANLEATLGYNGNWRVSQTGDPLKPYVPEIAIQWNNEERIWNIALTLQKDLLFLIKPDTTSVQRKAFFKQYDIDISEEYLRDESMIKKIAAAFTIGNSWIFESLDPEKKAGLYSEIGIRIDGWYATIDDAWLINQFGFSWLFWLSLREGENPSIGPSVNIRRSMERQDGWSIEQVAVMSFSNLVARMTLRKPVIQGNDVVWFGRASWEISSKNWLSVWAWAERMNMSGRWYNIDIGFWTKGIWLSIGRSDMIAGGENFSRRFTPSGIYTEMHYNPGLHIIDETWHIYGQMNDIFQFIHHTPEMARIFREVVGELSELGKKKQIIIHTEFASRLNSPQKMSDFLKLLKENREYFLSPNCVYESIHFDDVGSKKTHEIVPRLSQLHIHSLAYRKTNEKNENTESLGIIEKEIETELTIKYNINVRTSLEYTPKTIQALDILIWRMEKHGGIEKLRGKNITLTPDGTLWWGQEVVHHVITSHEKYQEILIPVWVLDSIATGRTPIIPFTQTPDDTARYEKLKGYFWFDSDLISVIHVVDDRDQNLQTPWNEWSFSPYSWENGIMYVSKTYYAMLEKVMNKGSRESLWIFDSLSIKWFELALRNIHIKNLEYLDTQFKKTLQSTSDGLKNLSREIGWSTLYDIRPSVSNNTQSSGYLAFDVHKSVTHERAWGFGIKLDNSGIHINIEWDNEYILTSPDDSRGQELFKRYTWLEKFLFGVKGTNPRTGKVEYLQANIQKLAKIERTWK